MRATSLRRADSAAARTGMRRRRFRRPSPAVIAGLLIAAASGEPRARGHDADFHTAVDGTFVLRAADGGVFEPAVPIFHDGVLIHGGNHKVIEVFDQAPATSSFPLTLADLIANAFVRPTYFAASGAGAPLATSYLGSVSLRSPSGLELVPAVVEGHVSTVGVARYQSTIDAALAAGVDVTATRAFPVPVAGRTEVEVGVQFLATSTVQLASGAPFAGNDRFRVGTVSSMFANDAEYDANVVRVHDAGGCIRALRLSGSQPRDAHLFATPIALGSWLELGNEPGSTWNPGGPALRVEVLDAGGLALGAQGFLAASTDVNDDSLSVWLEWLEAPDSIPSGSSAGVRVRLTATPPAAVPLFEDGFEAGAGSCWSTSQP